MVLLQQIYRLCWLTKSRTKSRTRRWRLHPEAGPGWNTGPPGAQDTWPPRPDWGRRWSCWTPGGRAHPECSPHLRGDRENDMNLCINYFSLTFSGLRTTKSWCSDRDLVVVEPSLVSGSKKQNKRRLNLLLMHFSLPTRQLGWFGITPDVHNLVPQPKHISLKVYLKIGSLILTQG